MVLVNDQKLETWVAKGRGNEMRVLSIAGNAATDCMSYLHSIRKVNDLMIAILSKQTREWTAMEV